MDAKLDYLRFTCNPLDDVDPAEDGLLNWFFKEFPEFKTVLLLDESETWCNYQHYNFCLCCKYHILIYYDSALDGWNKGVNVSIPSGGMWIIKDLFGFDNFIDFFIEIHTRSFEHNGLHAFDLKFTRLDICFDDFEYMKEGHYKTANEFNKLKCDRRILSRNRFCNDFHPEADQVRVTGGDSMGYTFYLGKRSADRMLRIYDKYIESARKRKEYLRHHPNDDMCPELVDSVRYEFEIHKRYANNLVMSLINSRRSGFKYCFRDFVDSFFKVSAVPIDRSNNNQSRDFKADEKWRHFCDLGFSENLDKPLLFKSDRKALSYYDVQNWVEKSVLGALACRLAVDGSLGSLEDLALHFLQSDEFPTRYKRIISEVTDRSFSAPVFCSDDSWHNVVPGHNIFA